MKTVKIYFNDGSCTEIEIHHFSDIDHYLMKNDMKVSNVIDIHFV